MILGEDSRQKDQAQKLSDAGKPEISFVVTNYNYGQYLYDAIRSITLQTGIESKLIEVILVDDFSTDDSHQVVNSLRRDCETRFSRFKFLDLRKMSGENQTNSESQSNRGKLHGLNIGLREVESPITIILDADDTLSPEFTNKTVSLLKEKSSEDEAIDFVYTDCMLINSDGTEIGVGKSRDFDPELLMIESYIPETAPTLTLAFKCEGVMPFNEDIPKFTKHHKWKRLVDSGSRGVYLPEPLLNYRMHGRNLSGISKNILKNRSFVALSNHWKPSSEK